MLKNPSLFKPFDGYFLLANSWPNLWPCGRIKMSTPFSSISGFVVLFQNPSLFLIFSWL
jgi:hypothetical protein